MPTTTAPGPTAAPCEQQISSHVGNFRDEEGKKKDMNNYMSMYM